MGWDPNERPNELHEVADVAVSDFVKLVDWTPHVTARLLPRCAACEAPHPGAEGFWTSATSRADHPALELAFARWGGVNDGHCPNCGAASQEAREIEIENVELLGGMT